MTHTIADAGSTLDPGLVLGFVAATVALTVAYRIARRVWRAENAKVDRLINAALRGHTCAVCGTAQVETCGAACSPCAERIWQGILARQADVYDHQAIERLHADLEAWNRDAAS